MGAIGKLFKNKQIVTIVALIVCFGILVFAYRYRVNSAINAVSVPIATKTLEARTEIDETCFEIKKVAQSMLSENVITNKVELLGDEINGHKYVNYNTFIPEGSLFYRSAITTWNNMPDSAWSNIADGKTIYSLDVRENNQYGNSIYPGDHIDLYLKGTKNQKYFIGPLIKGIKVLAVKDENGSHIFKKSAEQKKAAALIFEVDNENFLFLQKAYAVAGSNIIPILQNEKYSEEATEQKGEEYIRNYILERSVRDNPNEYNTSINDNTKITE